MNAIRRRRWYKVGDLMSVKDFEKQTFESEGLGQSDH